jgi:hypothetical protein
MIITKFPPFETILLYYYGSYKLRYEINVILVVRGDQYSDFPAQLPLYVL